MDIPILFEDNELVVIEKPSGVICNRAETVKTETLQDFWDARYGKEQRIENIEQDENSKYFVERSGLVHRLDKETSGVMVMAKTAQAFVTLLAQFKEREVSKQYLALTHGLWKSREGEITLPVGRMRHNRKQMGVREDGRESVTGYKVEREYRDWQFPKELRVETRGYTGFALVRFYPHTGRMHQIRVHSKHMGHSVVGDELYAGRKRSREDRKWCGRVMLHAAKLTLTHPVTEKRMSWESDKSGISEIAELYLQD